MVIIRIVHAGDCGEVKLRRVALGVNCSRKPAIIQVSSAFFLVVKPSKILFLI